VSASPSDASGHRPLTRAVDLLTAGDWQHAHEIVQEHESTLAAWLHGIVHTLEGDLDNAQYWYRRAQRPFRGAGVVQAEITEARAAVARHEG
jgi:hypothetical protein